MHLRILCVSLIYFSNDSVFPLVFVTLSKSDWRETIPETQKNGIIKSPSKKQEGGIDTVRKTLVVFFINFVPLFFFDVS